MFLSTEELVELTGKKHKPAQIRALRFMGIEHRIRPDGSLAVYKSHIDKEFAGLQTEKTTPKLPHPPWGEIR